ncbi:MAG TPA: choice-of-anchor Q domain-containing protein [Polyangiaceae bacterium]|nr:choice-of-anchor Q domain-containing protein [Polyangiaceae bacterium]
MIRTPSSVALCVAVLVSCFGTTAAAATYYVCDSAADCNAGAGSGWSTGSDARSKTQAQSRSTPWKTIDHAEENVGPGDTVIVGDGTYGSAAQEWNEVVLYIDASGTLAAPITFRAENKWGAVLSGANTMHGAIWLNCHASPPASHIRIQDFEIANFFELGVRSKDNNGAPYNTRCDNIELSGLRVHHVRHSGIELEATENSVVERNVIFDVYGGLPDAVNQYHGVYVSDNTDKIRVVNNLVYDIPHGWPVHVFDDHNHGGPASNHTFINNTLVNTNSERSGGIVAFGAGHVIRNNVLYEAVSASGYEYAIAESAGSGVVSLAENNLTNLPKLCKAGCPGASMANNTLNSNLTNEFTDPKTADYTQRPGALSIDTGTGVGAPKVDLLGASRPQGTATDIGAYEFPDEPADAGHSDSGASDASSDPDADAGEPDGAAAGPDAGIPKDAGTGMPSTPSNGASDDGGCQCSAPLGKSKQPVGLLLVFLCALLARRRVSCTERRLKPPRDGR